MKLSPILLALASGALLLSACGDDGGDVACAAGTVLQDGECIPDGSVICETGTTYNATTGKCDPDITGCAEGTVLIAGECVPLDDTLTGDVTEPVEPNGLNATDLPGMLELPAQGESTVISGCITPFEDIDLDGELDADFDAFLFTASGPTLLDLTVDGVGGLSGGFVVIGLADELDDDDWLRLGANLTSDTAQQQVFLPMAGTYVLAFADSRTLSSGLAFGSADTCYFATVEHLAMPAPTAITDMATGTLGDPQFYSFDPSADDAALNATMSALGPAAAGGLVVLVDGLYAGSSEDEGTPAAIETLLGLDATASVLLVVDAVSNFSLSGQPSSLRVREILPTVDPGDGSNVTLTHDPGFPGLLSFAATAGDVVRLEFDALGEDLDVFVLPPSASGINFADAVADVCFRCTTSDQWMQVQETGTYYYVVTDLAGVNGEDFTFNTRRTAVTPAPLTIGAPAAGDLTGRDRDFFVLDVDAADWLELNVVPTNFTDGAVTFYDRNGAGELDEILPNVDFDVSDGSPFARIYAGDDSVFLISIDNLAGHQGDETFSFEVADRPFTQATVAGGAPVDLNAVTLVADQPTYFLVTGPEAALLTSSLTNPSSGIDAVIELYDSDGNIVVDGVDEGGADAAETFVNVVTSSGLVPLSVTDVTGTGGTFDLNLAVILATITQAASAPNLDIPDGAGPGIPGEDAVDSATMAAGCATIDYITVDVDISHAFIGDLEVTLESPDGTVVFLHDHSGDGADDIIGTYPDTLIPEDSLDVLLGEDPVGDWTVTINDNFDEDDGELNSWGCDRRLLSVARSGKVGP